MNSSVGVKHLRRRESGSIVEGGLSKPCEFPRFPMKMTETMQKSGAVFSQQTGAEAWGDLTTNIKTLYWTEAFGRSSTMIMLVQSSA